MLKSFILMQLISLCFIATVNAYNYAGSDTIIINNANQFLKYVAGPDAAGKTIEINSHIVLNDNCIIPANVSLNILSNGFISTSQGRKIVILGKFSCNRNQCFNSSDNVVFGFDSVPAIYPEWFGANGDGKHDETSAVNAAVNASSIGMTIVGHGTYAVTQININKPLRLSNISFVAHNAYNPTEKQDILKITAPNVVVDNCSFKIVLKSMTNIKNSSCIYASHVNNLKITNCIFDGGKNLTVAQTEYGSVSIHDSYNIDIDNCKILNAQYEGLLLVSCNNALIDNIYAYNCGNSGIATTYGSEITIRKCTVDACRAANITLNSIKSSVEDCISQNAGTWGINLGHLNSPANDSNCIRNLVEGSGRLSNGDWGGVQMQASSNVVISDNVIKLSTNNIGNSPPHYNSGIVIGNRPGSCKIENNTIYSQPGYGVKVYDNENVSNIEIYNNKINDSFLTGIYVHGTSAVTVGNNLVENSNRLGLVNHSGVWIDGGSGNIRITDNVVRDNIDPKQNFGVLVSNSPNESRLILSNNTINGWTKNSVHLPKSAIVRDNKIW